MNKIELVNEIANATGMSVVETKKFLTAFLDVVSDKMERGETVQIKKFGVFGVRYEKPRIGQDIVRGVPVALGGRFLPIFTPSKGLVQRINHNTQEE